mmetsp:Transcript_475/g.1216  ORF Transcript_475/g.1216 Transcript_475/m.1216 type:complete len:279 (-) Transcript_475:1262-2098(-)
MRRDATPTDSTARSDSSVVWSRCNGVHNSGRNIGGQQRSTNGAPDTRVQPECSSSSTYDTWNWKRVAGACCAMAQSRTHHSRVRHDRPQHERRAVMCCTGVTTRQTSDHPMLHAAAPCRGHAVRCWYAQRAVGGREARTLHLHEEPNSLVNLSWRARSSAPTVGRAALTARSKCVGVTTGVRSAEAGTSMRLIRLAPRSFGSQGLHVPSLSCLKQVACCSSRTGSMSASRTRTERSAPERLSVRRATEARSLPDSVCGVRPRAMSRSAWRAGSSGNGI